MQVNNFPFFQQPQVGGYQPSPGRSPYGAPAQGSSPFGSFSGSINMLFSLLNSITQLSQGWGQFGGGGYQQPQQPVFGGGGGYQQPQQPVFGGGGGYQQPQQPIFGGGGYQQPQQPYFGGGGGYQQPQQPFYGGGGYQQPQVQPHDYASQHFPNINNYNPGSVATNPGGYGNSGGGANSLPKPSDPQEFASYIQAQIAGGALEGKTGIAQSDAIPGSRFGKVQDSTMWQASLARSYAYQFSAQAVGADPLSAQGLNSGMQAFDQMKPEAQLFMQVASVFKGDLLNGPGFYDNPGLKTLLESKGLGQFINDPQVGKTDVQTIGAITAAINSGQLSLNDVINSGTISDINRYNNVINYVTQGGFAGDLGNYDRAPV